MSKVIATLFAFVILFLIAGCNSDDSSTGPADQGPELSLSYVNLDYNEDQSVMFFVITNSGSGEMGWTISEDETWLSASPVQGVTTTEADTVIVTVDRSNMNAGQYNSTITATCDHGETGTVSISMDVELDSQLSVSIDFIHFPEGVETEKFAIRNIGGGSFDWSLTHEEDWLSVLPESGSTSSEVDSITVTVDRGVLNSGIYLDTVVVVCSNGQSDTVCISMEVPQADPIPLLSWNNAVLEEDHYMPSGPFEVTRDCKPHAELILSQWPGHYGIEILVMNQANYHNYINGNSFSVYWHRSIYSTGTYNVAGTTVIPAGTSIYFVVDNTNWGWEQTDFDFFSDDAFFDVEAWLQPE